MARQDGHVRYTLRIPPEVYDRFVAEVGERSINSAIVERLNAGGEILRDRFAMAALTGLLANPISSEMSDAEIASWAFRMADTMLAERHKGGAQ